MVRSNTTRHLRVTEQAKHACIRFWTWRVIFIVIVGAMVGQFLGSYVLPSPTHQFNMRLKNINEQTLETKNDVKKLKNQVDNIQKDIDVVKQKIK